jgi:hypothetical protein
MAPHAVDHLAARSHSQLPSCWHGCNALTANSPAPWKASVLIVVSVCRMTLARVPLRVAPMNGCVPAASLASCSSKLA